MTTKSKHTSSTTAASRKFLVLSIKELINEYVYRIDLDADYQREKVWNKTNQEDLLDSIVNDIDIPKLYLAHVQNNKQYDYECIDGKQRLLTLWRFFAPDPLEGSPQLVFLTQKYSYERLKNEHPTVAKRIEDYKLNFVVYEHSGITEEFIRLVFRRLQLGIRLNSGELLNSQMGTMRDFIFKEIGKDGPFLRNTNLSDKRYSRQFTLAQICLNSFSLRQAGDYGRARLTDIEYFFEEHRKISNDDPNLERIRNVLQIMDTDFGSNAKSISSRVAAVSAYLFVEYLYSNKKTALTALFSEFYVKLLDGVKENMELIADYQRPKNTVIMEDFQRYIIQASVEPYSIKRRHEFLIKAFSCYRDKGQIIG